MRLALVTDVFPPLRSSGAVQLSDLSAEFARQGHEIVVLAAAPGQRERWSIDRHQGVEIVRLKTFNARDAGHVRRAIGEALMPPMMLRNLRASPAASRHFDGIIWYSPTIFLGPVAKALKRRNACPGYLIVRDIFPEWAADMGLMGRGPVYRFFQAVADYQYAAADVIGVQTPGNLAFFERWLRAGKKVEVLPNWLTHAPGSRCSIEIGATALAGRRIFVYAGNMGVAQGMDKLLLLVEKLKDDARFGFVFVGRGSHAGPLREAARHRGLDNVLFFDEIGPEEIPGLYAQCSVGLVSLDARHRTHNIPGKFISYMHAGLPVLATINPGNDLEQLVARERVGRVSTDPAGTDLAALALAMAAEDLGDKAIGLRCTALAAALFSSQAAVRQIVAALAERAQAQGRPHRPDGG